MIQSLKIIVSLVVGVVIMWTLLETFKTNQVGMLIEQEKKEQLEKPMTHFIMIGMKKIPVGNGMYGYGTYNEEDEKATLSIEGKSNKVQYNVEEIKKRYRDMGAFGYLDFLYNKLNWILCDGSFFYGGEGSFHKSQPFEQGALAKGLQTFSYVSSPHYNIYQSFSQAIWITTQVFLVLSVVLIGKQRKDTAFFIIRLSIVGICMFVLIFEGRSRYIMNYLPFFIMLATSAVIKMGSIKSKIGQIVQKKRTREEKTIC